MSEYDIWSFTLREQNILQGFKIRVLSRIMRIIYLPHGAEIFREAYS
jgi:hypothetical protein